MVNQFGVVLDISEVCLGGTWSVTIWVSGLAALNGIILNASNVIIVIFSMFGGPILNFLRGFSSFSFSWVSSLIVISICLEDFLFFYSSVLRL